LNKGKPSENWGRKATGLKPQGHDSRVAGSSKKYNLLGNPPAGFFIGNGIIDGQGNALTEKGKPGENQGRRAKGLRTASLR